MFLNYSMCIGETPASLHPGVSSTSFPPQARSQLASLEEQKRT